MMGQTINNINDLIGDAKVVNGKIVYGAKKPHAGFESAVGISAAPLSGFIPGTDTTDFKERFKQIGGQAFLQAFDTLKGGGQITEIEGKIVSETQKVKELMGLIEKAPKAPKAKKADKKDDKKEEPKEEKEADDKKKAKELDEARFEKGEDVGKPGKGFAKVAKAAEKQYGSKEAGQKVAGAILKKVVAKGK